MVLVIIIDVLIVAGLVGITLTKGLERALPFFAFVVTLTPGASRIVLPGLFDLTTARIATVALLVLYLGFGKRGAGGERPQPVPLRYVILLIIGWSLVSALNSIVFTISIKAVLSNVLDFYLVYYLFVKTVTSTETTHRILGAFVAALLVCCVFGWVEAYYHWRVVDLFPSVASRFTPGQGGIMLDVGRVTSTFPHAILFGNALVLGIPWALYLVTLAKSSLRKNLLWASIVLMFWNIYKTMSRGPWLALMLSLLLLLLFSQGGVRKYLVVISVLATLVLVVRPGVWETVKDTYRETLDPESARGESYQYRYDLMRMARAALAKDLSRAAWGFGPESFYYLALEGEDPDTGHTEKFDSCDSAFVDVMVGTGYVGLALVLLLLLKFIGMSLRAFTRLPRPTDQLSLVFLVSLVAFAFMMASVMSWGWGQQSYMIWITFALSVACPRLVLTGVSPSESGVPERTERADPLPALAES